MRITSWSLLVVVAACSEYDFAGKTDAVPEKKAPEIAVDPTVVDFGAHWLGDAAPSSRVVTVENVGTAVLDVMDITLLDPSGPFSITTLSGVSLEPAETAEFAVSWTPDDVGRDATQAHVSSNDPDHPVVPVELLAEVLEADDTGETPSDPDPDPPPGTEPDVRVTPPTHDFGLLSFGDTAELQVDIHNVGDGDLIVEGVGFSTASSELLFEPDHGVNGAFPWHISPGATVSVWVDYVPTDDAVDSSIVTVQSNDPDESEATATQTGNARAFEGFSTGWYIYDDGIPYETYSNPSHVVDYHGDADLYWYEPSGAHGLIGSGDPAGDFEILRDYIIDRAGGPTVVSGPLNFSSGSDLATYEYATFTHILCDFYIDPAEDPASYEITASAVDDGIEVIVNSEIMGYMRLGEGATSWSLADVGRPGEVNTLVVILVDDSRVDRYLRDLAFYKDGVIVE
jgi:hypothetical protein